MSHDAEQSKKSGNIAFTYRTVALVFVLAAASFGLFQQNWGAAIPFFVLAISFFILGEEEKKKQDRKRKGGGKG